MMIVKGQPFKAVFLLVDLEQKPVEGLSPSVKISNGGVFTPTQNAAQEIGDGWYSIELTETETNTLDPLVLLADDPGAAFQWRDIHQVVSAQTGGGVSPEEVAQIVQAELEKWSMSIDLPIRLIRTSTEA